MSCLGYALSRRILAEYLKYTQTRARVFTFRTVQQTAIRLCKYTHADDGVANR